MIYKVLIKVLGIAGSARQNLYAYRALIGDDGC